jgi:endo-1,3-1,4-beta-glycanase ExoK
MRLSSYTFLAVLLLGALVPRTASAVQGAELYSTRPYFYGRFEARIRFAPGEGVVSSYFLWKDGSDTAASWNELDYEKVNGPCKLTTNIWSGKGTQSSQTNTTAFDVCADYHTYSFEWTPDYIAWFIDGTQIRRETGAKVTEYAQNGSKGMAIHFNLWVGDSSFGGTLNASTLPVRQYISWAQYSSYANGAFTQQWREEFNGSAMPTDWALGTWASPFKLSTHNPANVSFVNGIAVLSMTADNATGFTGTPPVDSAAGGTSGTGGAGGSGAGGSGGGAAGRGGAGGTTGGAGRGGTGGSATAGSGGNSSTGRGGAGPVGAAGNGGSGAGGMATGTAGNGAGGMTTGAAGNGAGGVASGSAGTSGPTGSAGTSATGSAGTGATAGTSGTGGMPTGGGGDTAGSGEGCSCGVGGDSLIGDPGLIAALLIAASLLRRRRIVRRSSRSLDRHGHAAVRL